MAGRIKRAQAFTVFIKDLEFQVKWETRLKTDPKSIILKEYYKIFEIYFQKYTWTYYSSINNMITILI